MDFNRIVFILGLVVTILFVAILVINSIVYKLRKKSLDSKLDEEYGKIEK